MIHEERAIEHWSNEEVIQWTQSVNAELIPYFTKHHILFVIFNSLLTHCYFSGKHLVKMIADKTIFNQIGIEIFGLKEELSEAIEHKIVGMGIVWVSFIVN